MRVIRLVDDTMRLIRAPEVSFAAAEIGLEAFGYNIANRTLVAALEARARELPALQWIADEACAVEIGDARATIRLTNGECSALLVIGADGRRSLCRAAAGIETDGSGYPQTALTFNLGHARQHGDISTEFHTESGPFTLVPLPGLRSSLVCVVDPAEAERLAALDDAELADEIERRSHSILGKITLEPGRGAFPLAVETARRFGRNRVALVGEAAHRCRRSARRASISACAMPRPSASLSCMRAATGGDVGNAGAAGALRRAAPRPTSRAARSRSISSTAACCPAFSRSKARAVSAIFLIDRIGPLRRARDARGRTAGVAASPHARRGALTPP